jgi:hypothetical protein
VPSPLPAANESLLLPRLVGAPAVRVEAAARCCCCRAPLDAAAAAMLLPITENAMMQMCVCVVVEESVCCRACGCAAVERPRAATIAFFKNCRLVRGVGTQVRQVQEARSPLPKKKKKNRSLPSIKSRLRVTRQALFMSRR